jgi:hypothetical protein
MTALHLAYQYGSDKFVRVILEGVYGEEEDQEALRAALLKKNMRQSHTPMTMLKNVDWDHHAVFTLNFLVEHGWSIAQISDFLCQSKILNVVINQHSMYVLRHIFLNVCKTHNQRMHLAWESMVMYRVCLSSSFFVRLFNFFVDHVCETTEEVLHLLEDVHPNHTTDSILHDTPRPIDCMDQHLIYPRVCVFFASWGQYAVDVRDVPWNRHAVMSTAVRLWKRREFMLRMRTVFQVHVHVQGHQEN